MTAAERVDAPIYCRFILDDGEHTECYACADDRAYSVYKEER